MSAPAPPIVLASGQLLTQRFWDPVAPHLAGREVLHADNGSDETIEAMAGRLLAQAPPRFDLVAHAMGGFTAFAVMRAAPDRVRRLVLLSTLASADGPAQTERRLSYLKLVEAGDFAGVVEARIPILINPRRREEPALLGAARDMARETGPERFLRQQRAIMARIDSRPRLSEIACPTLIAAGRQDGIVTPEHQAEMAGAIAGARLETIEDCGHLLTLERPEIVGPLIRGFLDAA